MSVVGMDVNMINSTTSQKVMPDFPVLMIHEADLDRDDPMVVIFTDDNAGTIVSQNLDSPKGRPVGYHGDFSISAFLPYTGVVTLTNSWFNK